MNTTQQHESDVLIVHANTAKEPDTTLRLGDMIVTWRELEETREALWPDDGD